MNIKCIKTGCIALLVFFFSCRSDKPLEEVEPSITITPNSGVFIINEGNFTRGNGSVGYYNKATGDVIEDLYKPINKQQLGDVVQSMNIFNGKAYLMVNNPLKVEVVDPETFVSLGVIKGITSPRYLLPVSNGKAYVSNYKTNTIHIIDLNNKVVTGGISCGYGEFNEQMVLAYGKAYVTTPASNKVYVINTRTDVVEDSIPVGRGASSIQEDANGKLWVLCSGKESANELAGLYRIDPVSNKVEWSSNFSDNTQRPGNLVSNGDHTALFYISNEGVFKFMITSETLPSTPIIPRGTMYLYAIGIDPKDGTIYVGDASGFTAAGVVYRYKPDGTFINSFRTGIGPNSFYFN